ncbi:hypothetical protein VZT92_001906 [Zoarces viviparus]|uniref:Uncharacterized protein n=1 Tax=Zoarces viviparus TaxID=48416 RepID=A0AAW1G521_ZOAVI
MSSKTCYLKQQQAAATFFFPPSTTTRSSPSPLPIAPLSMHPTPSACQAAGCLENNAPIIAERGLTPLPPPHPTSPAGVRWDWLLPRAPGFPDSGQNLGPLCCSQERGALMITPLPLKQSQRRTGTGRKQSAHGDRSQYLYFPAER